MTELETAAHEWKVISDNAPIDKHPSFMVAHFSGDECLGSIFGHKVSSEPNLVMILGSPFAMTHDISDTFIFLDRPGHLIVSHLEQIGSGVHTTDWQIPYTLNDWGKVEFGVAQKAMAPDKIRLACDHLSDHRLRAKPKHGFLEAFVTAQKWGELHETN